MVPSAILSPNSTATATVINTATPATAAPSGKKSLTVDGPSLTSPSKGKEKFSAPNHHQPEILFPVGRAPPYFDCYPRQMSHPPATQQRYGLTTSSLHSDLSSNSNYANVAVNRSSGRSDPKVPSPHCTHNDDLVLKQPPPAPRRRSRRVPNRSSSENRSELAYLRISDSSSLTQLETPPQTPDDLTTPRPLFDPFSVVVSAPVPGVETMDALVDGMNSFASKDDFLWVQVVSPVQRAPRRDSTHFFSLRFLPLPQA
jgi:hypothetical protein